MAGIKLLARRRRWAGLVREWRCSGLSQAAFCRQRSLNAVSFNWWTRRKAVGGSGPIQRETPAAFVPVRITPASPIAGRIPFEILLRSGHTLRIAQDFDPVALDRLIGVLEQGGIRSC